MHERVRSPRETSSHSNMGDRYRYRAVYSSNTSRDENLSAGQSSEASHHTESESRYWETGAERKPISNNRIYPGYRPEGASRATSTFTYPASLGSIGEDAYLKPDPRSARVHRQAHQVARIPLRQEYTGPFADQSDQLIFQQLSKIPSMELTDSSGSGSSHSSNSESTCWMTPDEKSHALHRSFSLGEKPHACDPGFPGEKGSLAVRNALPRTPIPSVSCQAQPSCPTIEVAPGEFLRLRGAAETSWAIENDFYAPSECVCCTQTILCILDADYVLCPDCRVVGPIRPPQERSNGGVGLGCRPDALF